MEPFVHPTAVVDDGAKIGLGSYIWHFVHVCGGASIGENVSLGQNVFVGGKASIGDRCKIQNNVSIYDNVVIGNDVFCGPSVVFTNILNPRAFLNRKNQFLSTYVENFATLGANSTIICGITVGEHSLIGAGAVVTKNVGRHALMMGVPAKQTGWVCRLGNTIPLPVKGNGVYNCPLTKTIYRLVRGVLQVEDSLA